jgi:hypothetical protein
MEVFQECRKFKSEKQLFTCKFTGGSIENDISKITYTQQQRNKIHRLNQV